MIQVVSQHNMKKSNQSWPRRKYRLAPNCHIFASCAFQSMGLGGVTLSTLFKTETLIRVKLKMHLVIINYKGPSGTRLLAGGPLGLLTLSFAPLRFSDLVTQASQPQKIRKIWKYRIQVLINTVQFLVIYISVPQMALHNSSIASINDTRKEEQQENGFL